MSKPDFNTDAFFSAVKRKDMHDLLVIIFTETGFDKAAQEAKEMTRVTDAALRRIRDTLNSDEEVVDEVVEEERKPEELTYADDLVKDEEEVENELVKLIDDVKSAIESGKKKKAKKAFKALKATGVSGSEIDKLKKQIKKMED